MKMKKSTRIEIIATIGIFIFFAIYLSPILIALSGSFRGLKDTTSYLEIFKTFSLESYKMAYSKMYYFRSLKNSIIVTSLSIIILLITCSIAGYAIARLKGKLGNFFQVFFMAGMIVSAQMSIIPMYNIMRTLGLSNTMASPVILYATSSLSFSIFLYISFIKSGVPFSLEEAARIDGAGTIKTYVRIVMPLTKPALASIIITQGVPIWNDFFFTMLFLSAPEQKTLPLVMLNFIGDMENATQWNMLFAACFLSAIPILIIYGFLQKQFVGGLTVGAVKG